MGSTLKARLTRAARCTASRFTLLALLASTFFPACYNIYAVFTATGIVTGPNQFQSVSGTLSVYIDPNQDTTWSITSFINPATPRAARR